MNRYTVEKTISEINKWVKIKKPSQVISHEGGTMLCIFLSVQTSFFSVLPYTALASPSLAQRISTLKAFEARLRPGVWENGYLPLTQTHRHLSASLCFYFLPVTP